MFLHSQEYKDRPTLVDPIYTCIDPIKEPEKIKVLENIVDGAYVGEIYTHLQSEMLFQRSYEDYGKNNYVRLVLDPVNLRLNSRILSLDEINDKYRYRTGYRYEGSNMILYTPGPEYVAIDLPEKPSIEGPPLDEEIKFYNPYDREIHTCTIDTVRYCLETDKGTHQSERIYPYFAEQMMRGLCQI